MNRRIAILVAAGLAAAALGADPPQAPAETPKDVGLVEQASTRLAQLDVTVSGPKGGVQGLTAADFEVRINHKLIPNLFVDDLCVPPPAATAVTTPESPGEHPVLTQPQTEVGKPSVATYLLYFDMVHLTQPGRRDAIDAAREMIPKLLAGGQRAMIVASAAQLKTIVPLTSDVTRLETASVMCCDHSQACRTAIHCIELANERDRL